MPTTINDELTRIEGAKADIATAIGGKGVTVPANTKLDGFADLIDAIPTGGGTDNILLGIINKTITSVDIPEGATSIPQYFFYNCSNLATVNFPTSITSFEQSCFRATSLISVDLRGLESLASIVTDAFNGCRNLVEIYLPLHIGSIGVRAFTSCSSLGKVVIMATNPPSLGSNAFASTPIASGTGKIYVPNGFGNTYKSASGWSSFANQIYELDSNGNIPT